MPAHAGIHGFAASFWAAGRRGRFFKKSAAKNVCFPQPLSGQTVAAQRPGEVKVFCGAFFQKSDCLLDFTKSDRAL
jgi:hypothetical protein